MATYADLKVRIIAETDRDDLDDGEESAARLVNAVSRAVEFYSSTQFWFNRGSGTVATVGGEPTVALPAGVRFADKATLNGCLLRKYALEAVEHKTGLGQPSVWAESGSSLRLHAIPDGVYTISVFGPAAIPAPALEADDNIWTNEAQDLIAARARFVLCRDVFRDNEGAQLAAQAEGEALTRLREETRKRGFTPLRSNGDEPWTARTSFNIYTG